MITPTIGRVVWFYPSADSSGQAFPALVNFVHNDRCINVAGFNHGGTPFSQSSCLLLQEGDPAPSGAHARWMPYQVGQAKKHEAERPSAPQPPQDNAHVAPGCELFGTDFGAALAALKAGKRVARAGWNGKGMFVYLVPANSYPAQTGAAKSFFGDGGMVPYNAYLALKGADDTVSTWAPSGSDALAEDWLVVS